MMSDRSSFGRWGMGFGILFMPFRMMKKHRHAHPYHDIEEGKT